MRNPNLSWVSEHFNDIFESLFVVTKETIDKRNEIVALVRSFTEERRQLQTMKRKLSTMFRKYAQLRDLSRRIMSLTRSLSMALE